VCARTYIYVIRVDSRRTDAPPPVIQPAVAWPTDDDGGGGGGTEEPISRRTRRFPRCVCVCACLCVCVWARIVHRAKTVGTSRGYRPAAAARRRWRRWRRPRWRRRRRRRRRGNDDLYSNIAGDRPAPARRRIAPVTHRPRARPRAADDSAEEYYILLLLLYCLCLSRPLV